MSTEHGNCLTAALQHFGKGNSLVIKWHPWGKVPLPHFAICDHHDGSLWCAVDCRDGGKKWWQYLWYEYEWQRYATITHYGSQGQKDKETA